jgi:type II secretory pathway pseudopilin PulG
MEKNRVVREVAGGDDRGLGILEIVIAMFLLALLVLSFAPVLVTTVKLSARNTTIATATQIVNQQIEAARAVSTLSTVAVTCTVVTAFLAVTPAPVVDPRGVTLQAQWDSPSCPASYPGVVRVRVSVTQAGYSIPTASADTMILVAAP